MCSTVPVVEVLSDGTRVRIRAIEPADRALLERGFARLSPESRYRRFLGPRNQLTDAELDYLTQVDGRDHVAIGAVSETEPEEGLAIARFIRGAAANDGASARDPATAPDAAELAISVADDHQGRGLGRILVMHLATIAAGLGIQRFRCEVLSTNTPMLHLLSRLGGHVVAATAGTVTVEMAIVSTW